MNLIIQGDSGRIIPLIQNKVDGVVTDPPYGIKASALHMKPVARPDGGDFSGVTSEWDKEHIGRAAHKAFIDLQLLWYEQIVKEGGVVVTMGTYHNLPDTLSRALDRGGFILNQAAWIKTNPVPNFRGVRLTSSIEGIGIYQPHGKSSHYFGYEELKQYNDGKQLREDIFTDYHSEELLTHMEHFGANPFIMDPTGLLIRLPVCRGKERLKVEDNSTKSGKRVLHQTQKPEKLFEILVTGYIPPNGLFLDPFAGVGTSGVAAPSDRNFIMIEREPEYVEAAVSRLEEKGKNFTLLKEEDVIKGVEVGPYKFSRESK